MLCRTIGCALALTVISNAAQGGAIAPNADEICPIRIGSSIPEAAVRTATGDPVDLRETLSGSPAVLIVYRGGWCPMCTMQFAGLTDAVGPLQQLGMALYAMSVDDPKRLVTGRGEDSPFTLLSDFELNAVTELGLAFEVPDAYIDTLAQYNLDTAGNAIATEQVLPVPAVFVLDKEATITFSYINPNYQVRCDPSVLIAAAQSLMSNE